MQITRSNEEAGMPREELRARGRLLDRLLAEPGRTAA